MQGDAELCQTSNLLLVRQFGDSWEVRLYELASKIYAWSVFVSLLSVPYRFPWFWILQVCIHRGIVFCQSPIVFQGKSRKQHRDETSLTKVVDDNFEVASYVCSTCSRVHDTSRLFISSFLGGGLAGQGLRNMTPCRDRVCRALKREAKCEFWLGWRQPSVEIARVKC